MVFICQNQVQRNIIKQFAEWGISFIKVDDVAHRPSEIEGYVKAIKNMWF